MERENVDGLDWCTKHGRMLKIEEGNLTCPECEESVTDEEELQELKENWIKREVGNWKCERHGKDLELNDFDELVCLDCVDEMVTGDTASEEVDKRWSRKS